MKKILVLFAHPALERSRVNRELIKGLDQMKDITFHDLYQLYPDFYIDVQREQELLLLHDMIIWQHPLYWYSVPPLLKQWIDLVFEHGWAYGNRGGMLRGKYLLNVITAGGGKEAYCDNGYNRYTIPEFLRPYEQTACLCGMRYLPPFVIHETHRLQVNGIDQARKEYHLLLQRLQRETFDPSQFNELDYLNEWLISTTEHQA